MRISTPARRTGPEDRLRLVRRLHDRRAPSPAASDAPPSASADRLDEDRRATAAPRAAARTRRALPKAPIRRPNDTGPTPAASPSTTQASRSSASTAPSARGSSPWTPPARLVAAGGTSAPQRPVPADARASAGPPEREAVDRRPEPRRLVEVARAHTAGAPVEVGDRAGDPQQPVRAPARQALPLREHDRPGHRARRPSQHARRSAAARTPRPFGRRPLRAAWRARAAAIRPATVADDSGGRPRRATAGATRSTATHRSIRSRSGPETRRRYRSGTPGGQLHARSAEPSWPHGHGFIAATNVNRAGNDLAPADPHDGHAPLLERLAQRLEHVATELGQLVAHEHALVGEGHLAGRQPRTAADHPGVRASCGGAS